VSVRDGLAQVREALSAAAERAGRDAAAVTLIAVSKTHEAARVQEAIDAGQRHFGENRVQEAQGKFPPLTARYPDVHLHLIGGLQTNKAEDAVALFDTIHSLDRPKLARALAKASEKLKRAPDLFIQVNTGAEAQKSGCLPGDLESLYRLATEELCLPVVGLMCVPPLEEPAAPHFQFLRERAQELGLTQLSMGMSGDFADAIALGATHVRVGTAIFGARPPLHGA